MTADLPVLVLFGPTASGKTGLLQRLNRRPDIPPLEIISADSRQVYRGFRIGTAAPTPEQQSALPHHLVGTHDPREAWDVGTFVAEAERLVAAIRSRGNVPVVSGGTAFYLQGYIAGLPGTPRASEDIRARLQRRLQEEGADVLRAELERIDPVRAQQIAPGDSYRVLRALEVFAASGERPSSFRMPRTARAGFHGRVIGLSRPRAELYERINRRVDRMFEDGLVDEVAGLLASGIPPDAPAFSSIGYREFVADGRRPPWSPAELERIRSLIARNTRRYARRQELFFRRLPDVSWMDAGDPDSMVEQVADGLDMP